MDDAQLILAQEAIDDLCNKIFALSKELIELQSDYALDIGYGNTAFLTLSSGPIVVCISDLRQIKQEDKHGSSNRDHSD